IEEINILSSLRLYEQYKHIIPVIVLDDAYSFISRIDWQEVEKILRTLSTNTKTQNGANSN
ncbi:MAG: hypothetical protein ONB16_11590, partial [candidate division KSB1 bacterium]|nr:hypothetical protein [candidate division KSB1 bacterium]